MNKTNIEYLDFTSNPLAMRCTPVSSGCANCWHLRVVDRLKNNPKIALKEKMAYAGVWPPVIREKELRAPLRMQKPSMIGLQLMGDLFHKQVEWPTIDKILLSCQIAQQHTHLILTKRIETAFYYFRSPVYGPESQIMHRSDFLKNNRIWVGVSVEDERSLEERGRVLKEIPAKKRFLSIEPMLEEMSLNEFDVHWESFIDWIIIGAETGPGARVMRLQWLYKIVAECIKARVPVFVKAISQNGRPFSEFKKYPSFARRREYPE